MDKIPRIVMTLVFAAVLLAFGLGIGVAAYYTLWIEGAPKPTEMPDIVAYFVSAANGTLAANLGAVLGIRLAWGGERSALSTTEIFQWFAAGWYVLMLLLAVLFWGMAGFREDEAQVVSLLPEMTKTAIGIFIAILAAVLGVQTLRGSRRGG